MIYEPASNYTDNSNRYRKVLFAFCKFFKSREPSAAQASRFRSWLRIGKCCCADHLATEALLHIPDARQQFRYKQIPKKTKNESTSLYVAECW